jgi:hypothetical protein
VGTVLVTEEEEEEEGGGLALDPGEAAPVVAE